MPIYEFSCKECGTLFEKIVLGSIDEVKIDCPKCGSLENEKLISAPGSVGVKDSKSSGCPSGAGSCCASKFT